MRNQRAQFKMLGTTLLLAICLLAFVELMQKKTNTVRIQCDSTKGPFEIVLQPQWSPQGVERFLQLVQDGFFQDLPLFRCVDSFICQFGAVPDSAGSKKYDAILDDPPQTLSGKFKRGYLSFAGSGPNTRSTHLFITLGESVDSLGAHPWETPIGFVTSESMAKTVSRWTTSYGEMPPWGTGPEAQKIESSEGRLYLQKYFPNLDYILKCSRR